MKKILLIYPPTNPSNPGAELDVFRVGELPFGVMNLAAYLEDTGYDVKILDGRVYQKSEIFNIIEKEISHTDAIGFSILTVQTKFARKIASFIRSKDKDIPLIWGGIHPTLFPEQTIKDEFVDYAIHGEGEYALVNLLKNLENGAPSLDSIEGLVYKENGRVLINKDSPPVDLNKLPDPAYHLIDIEKYVDKKLFNGERVRSLGILTSRGCPYRCAFCTNRILTARAWRPIPTDRILNTLDELITKYKLNHILFVDDYFFGNTKRVEKIVTTMLERNYGLKWEANARVDNFNSKMLNDEFLTLLKKSGCISLRMGAESGSDRILRILKKDIQVEQTINAIKQCKKHDIVPLCYFMVGIPGETTEEAKQTFQLLLKLHDIHPGSRIIVPAVFRPYPGGELYTECVKAGYKEPESLQSWGDANLDEHYLEAHNLPWIKDPDLIEDMRDYYVLYNTKNQETKFLYKIPLKVVSGLARMRFENDFWRARLEVRIANLIKKHVKLKWRA